MGNVPDDVTDIDLAEYFSQVGEVLSAQLRGNDGGHYGFVEFAYPEDVQNVLGVAEQQPFQMGDNYLRVQPRRQKDQRQVRFFAALSAALNWRCCSSNLFMQCCGRHLGFCQDCGIRREIFVCLLYVVAVMMLSEFM